MLIISMLINTRKARVTKPFDPDRSLGVLISDVARLLRRNFDRRLQSLGLTQAQWRAIVHVSRSEGMNQVALAECLEIQPITVARLIDRMEAAGWIERRNDPLDRRAVRLFLTAKCQPVLEEIHARAAETIAESVLGVAASTQNQVFEGLQRIKQNLVTAELKTSAANEPIGRTNRDAGRKPTRIQRTR
jgi:MarR family transcriptional regulator for hemolysin